MEPSRVEPKEGEKKNRQFWKQVLEETEKMTRYYPGYLKAGIESVTLSDAMAGNSEASGRWSFQRENRRT